MITEVIIEAEQYNDTGAINEQGDIGQIQYTVPVIPLPDNMLTNRLEVREGKVVYVVTFDDGLPEPTPEEL